jgi:hypothetical protein
MGDFAAVLGPSITFNVILPLVIGVMVIIFISICLGTYLYAKKKDKIFNEKAVYYCVQCSSPIKLEAESCKECGAENVSRKAALEKLEELKASIEVRKTKILEKLNSKKSRVRNLANEEWDLLERQAQKICKRKMSLLQGSSLTEK